MMGQSAPDILVPIQKPCLFTFAEEDMNRSPHQLTMIIPSHHVSGQRPAMAPPAGAVQPLQLSIWLATVATLVQQQLERALLFPKDLYIICWQFGRKGGCPDLMDLVDSWAPRSMMLQLFWSRCLHAKKCWKFACCMAYKKENEASELAEKVQSGFGIGPL